MTFAALVLSLFLAAPVAPGQDAAGAVGLFPVYDATGEAYGEALARHLTTALFEALVLDGRRYVSLNPGGEYRPLDESASFDYAKSSGVAAVIIPVLRPTRRENRQDGRPEIVAEVHLVDLASGQSSGVASIRQEVKRRDLERGFEVGNWSKPSRRLSKQPLGKAVLKMAQDLRTVLASTLARAVVLTAAPGGSRGDSCEVEFRVRYVQQRTASRTYNIIVNGFEESLNVREGALKLTASSGPLVIELSVKDAPFRLPAQGVYLANTFVDCGRPERALTLEIGPGGDALLVWR